MQFSSQSRNTGPASPSSGYLRGHWYPHQGASHLLPCDNWDRLQHSYDPELDTWLRKRMSEELFSHIGTTAVLYNNLADEHLTNVKTVFNLPGPKSL